MRQKIDIHIYINLHVISIFFFFAFSVVELVPFNEKLFFI